MTFLAPFPDDILNEIRTFPGNNHCCDCNSLDVDWASISHGTLICLECAGKHRSLGVQTSVVRSIKMDSWTTQQVEMMRQGGNSQIQRFFRKLEIEKTSIITLYISKGADHYRSLLKEHVDKIISGEIKSTKRDIHKIHCSQSDIAGNTTNNHNHELNHKLNYESSYERMNIKNNKHTPDNINNHYQQHHNSIDNKNNDVYEYYDVTFHNSGPMGMTITKDFCERAIISKIVMNGSACMAGVQINDYISAIDGINVYQYEEIMQVILNSPRPICIKFSKCIDRKQHDIILRSNSISAPELQHSIDSSMAMISTGLTKLNDLYPIDSSSMTMTTTGLSKIRNNNSTNSFQSHIQPLNLKNYINNNYNNSSKSNDDNSCSSINDNNYTTIDNSNNLNAKEDVHANIKDRIPTLTTNQDNNNNINLQINRNIDNIIDHSIESDYIIGNIVNNLNIDSYRTNPTNIRGNASFGWGFQSQEDIIVPDQGEDHRDWINFKQTSIKFKTEENIIQPLTSFDTTATTINSKLLVVVDSGVGSITKELFHEDELSSKGCFSDSIDIQSDIEYLEKIAFLLLESSNKYGDNMVVTPEQSPLSIEKFYHEKLEDGMQIIIDRRDNDDDNINNSNIDNDITDDNNDDDKIPGKEILKEINSNNEIKDSTETYSNSDNKDISNNTSNNNNSNKEITINTSTNNNSNNNTSADINNNSYHNIIENDYYIEYSVIYQNAPLGMTISCQKQQYPYQTSFSTTTSTSPHKSFIKNNSSKNENTNNNNNINNNNNSSNNTISPKKSDNSQLKDQKLYNCPQVIKIIVSGQSESFGVKVGDYLFMIDTHKIEYYEDAMKRLLKSTYPLCIKFRRKK